MKQLTILGSTGSVGTSTTAVVRANPDRFAIKALVAGLNVAVMAQQCMEFRPAFAAMAEESAARELRAILANGVATEVLAGEQAACELAALDDVDQVTAAIVGAAGLLPTLAAIRAGKQVLLANKESLVTCGRLFMDAVRQSRAQLLPLDSEHNAIFRVCLRAFSVSWGTSSSESHGVSRIVLPAQAARSAPPAGAVRRNDAGSSLRPPELVDGPQDLGGLRHHDEQRSGIY